MNLSAIHREEVLSLAQHLISMESHRDAVGREVEIGRFLAEWFRERGVDAELQPVEGERANVIARIRGSGGPSVILNGHLDTVPAGDMPDAFSPRIEDGTLWGRGACDMKGAIAAMCCAMVTIARDEASLLRPVEDEDGVWPRSSETPPRLHGDLIFAATVDEESGSLGVKALVDAGITADFAVIGEPTSLRVAISHKGSCFVRILLTGRGAHGSCPEQGVNAASYAARIVAAIEDELRPRLVRRTYPLLGPSSVSVGRICGGTQPNIVAERCEIDIDRRYVPGEPSPVAEIQHIVTSICHDIEGLSFDVAEMPMTSKVPHVPLGTSPDSLLVQAATEICGKAGLPAEPVGVTYWSDGGQLAASGIETIVLGPGDIADAHGPNDHVAVDDLTAAVDLYRDLALRLLLTGVSR
jgi:succinyl-diaminopimelate desuccinylase